MLGPGAAAEGDHRIVFEQDQDILARLAADVKQTLLQGQGRPVGQPARPQSPESIRSGRRGRERSGSGYCQWMQATGQASMAS